MAQESLRDAESSRATKLSCLPKDIRNDEVVSYGVNGKQNVTVEKKLGDLKTRCRRGSLAPKGARLPGTLAWLEINFYYGVPNRPRYSLE
jgi:hypothetical protein